VAETASNETPDRSHLEDRPRVLVVDDEPGVRQVIRVNLVMQGHEVLEAKNGAHALRLIDQNGIDLVILDLMMPKVSGWDVLEAVRERRGSRAMPIIVLSAVTTEDAKLKAFDLGAADYIVKPFAVGELLARVNRTLHERKEKQVLAEFSITDWVTGLFNRRYLELRLPQEVSRALRYGRPLSALFFEVDQLPWLLEERGPQFVDGILQEVASLVRGETRACDILFRYDGDYFIALLPDTPLIGGVEVANRIRRRMLESEWNQEVGLSGTFGVVELQEGEDAAKLLTRAEEALLTAKRSGGNAVWPPRDDAPKLAAVPSDDVAEVEGFVEGYPVEEGPAQPIFQQEIGPAQSEQFGDLQSSATQQIDPSLLAQVQQQLGGGHPIEVEEVAGGGGQSVWPSSEQEQTWQPAPQQWGAGEVAPPDSAENWGAGEVAPPDSTQQWGESGAYPPQSGAPETWPEQWSEPASEQWTDPQPEQWSPPSTQDWTQPQEWSNPASWDESQTAQHQPDDSTTQVPPYQAPPQYPADSAN
jgi:diguanylate cyclase (GGDEF)-like protein